jgi:hypothetical protein
LADSKEIKVLRAMQAQTRFSPIPGIFPFAAQANATGKTSDFQ